MSHPPSFTSLPEELQAMVASHLSQDDAATCLRVCQAWKRLFTPFVWRHIESKSSIFRRVNWETALLESAKYGSLKTHGQWIQSINLSCYPDFIEKFLDLSPEFFPRLTSLSFNNPESDFLIGALIRKAPSPSLGNSGNGLRLLEVYGFEGYDDFGGYSADALLEHASTLEVVQLDMMPSMSSKMIQQFLCSAVHLKEFSIIGVERDSGNKDFFLDAHDVVSSDWVCTELEVFGCQIGGIPRPDIVQEIAGQPASDFVKEGTHQESLDLQRGVYSQLARLTKLRELTLGVSVKSDWGYNEIKRQRDCQHDCLAMTVESGLDLLKDLKELEMVVLDDMDVFIFRDEEKAWVEKNWPKVKGNLRV